MSLKKLLVAGVAAFLPMNALGSELGGERPFSWTGVYVGASVGGAAAGTTVGSLTTMSLGRGTDDAGYYGMQFGGAEQRPFSVGAMGGLALGFNLQSGRLVFGLVGDLSALSLRGRDSSASGFVAEFNDTDTCTTSIFGGTVGTTATCSIEGGGTPVVEGFGATGSIQTSAESRLMALATLRMRAGIAFDRGLIYATGGLALGRTSTRLRSAANIDMDHHDVSDDSEDRYVDLSTSGWRPGFVVGAGAEYAIASSWSLGVEALYYNLGTRQVSVRGSDGVGTDAQFDVATTRVRTSGMIGRVGLNYRF